MKLPAFLTTAPSIGDFICSTPTIRKIAKTYGTKVLVISPNPGLLKNNPYVSESLDLKSVDISVLEQTYDIHKSFHLLGKRDKHGIEFKHAMCDIRQFHAKDLGFMLTPDELSCDYFPDKAQICMTEINLPEKYIVIHPAQSWDSRTWEIEKWQVLVDGLCNQGVFVVAVGKDSGEYSMHLQQDKPAFSLNIKNGIDLTNKTTLDQTWHILNNSIAVITMDSGILHLAGTTDTHIIQLGSSIDPYFRAPYRNGSQKYKYNYVLGSCKIHCASDLSYSLRDWHDIQAVTLIHTCLENKKEFDTFIWEKFNKCCFNCGTEIQSPNDMNLDHTMPLVYLYPLDATATCLCPKCNSAKSDSFPIDFYTQEKLVALAEITGISLETLQLRTSNEIVIKKLKEKIIWFFDTLFNSIKYSLFGGCKSQSPPLYFF
jgi:ADP-heptose:LPS heptosyltransferase